MAREYTKEALKRSRKRSHNRGLSLEDIIFGRKAWEHSAEASAPERAGHQIDET
jgi:hypothetical protein